MATTLLYIKNMVCDRCVKVVSQILAELHLPVVSVTLGSTVIDRELTEEEKHKLNLLLEKEGFALIEDKKIRLLEAIKHAAIDWVQHGKMKTMPVNFSTFLSETLQKDYHYLSNLFSEHENITIEQYLILQKIEKVKELLSYGEMSLSEIADELGYSSVAHLSLQFKRMTGFTPTQFRKLKDHHRKPLDRVGE
ncbi:MAG: helix-turn-helix transcriptional regulator [Thermoflavifilum sp.]|uniref:helix-turn-helix domain-containing protein n=1 Tax=Thermoflavifilum sp. TaxID=1968839 RepID=UPI0018A69E28|nr:helix-turn-helix domain-containing protein [Thermoflavifilum sp.]QOR75724.1 MAG: helix-turn-helix transcriptional regulator [Thermoflavifilum sp.]